MIEFNEKLWKVHEIYRKHAPTGLKYRAKNAEGPSIYLCQCSCGGHWFYKYGPKGYWDVLYGDVAGIILARNPKIYDNLRAYYFRYKGKTVKSIEAGRDKMYTWDSVLETYKEELEQIMIEKRKDQEKIKQSLKGAAK